MKRNQVAMLIGITLIVVLVMGGVWVYRNAAIGTKCPRDGSVTHIAELSDGQRVHLPTARANGIKPVADRNYDFAGDKRLVMIRSCEAYKVRQLTHSVPYLTTDAANLLRDIGEEFQLELSRRGCRTYRIILSSALRTGDDVKMLKTKNVNAVTNSAHCYVTTFDLTYASYQRVDTVGRKADANELTSVLCDVLKRMRNQGRCHVMMEHQQHCFHITARPS